MEATALQQWFSSTPAEWLIASIWQGLLLTLFASAVLTLAGRLRASTRFALWLIVFLLIALLPCFAAGRALWGMYHSPAAATAAEGWSLRINIVWAFALEGVWAFASLYSLTRLILGVRQMIRLRRTSALLPFSSLSQAMQSIVTRPGSRPVEVRLSATAEAPSVLGFFRPSIIVPRSLWNELSPESLQQILLHEMAHLDRRDDWSNLLQKLLRAVCPLNPALFWAERQLCREREQACDDAVLDAAGNGRAYATCLTNLAAHTLVRRAAILAPGLWRRPSELAARIDNILHRRPGLKPVLARGLVAASLLASVAGVVGLQRCPRLVSFASSETIAAETAPRPLPADRHAYEARYADEQKPMYQEAAFHPQTKRDVVPAPAAAVRTTVKAHRDAAHVRSGLRLVAVPTFDEQSPTGISWVLFTVDAHSRALPAVPIVLQNFSTPDNWIVFSI